MSDEIQPYLFIESIGDVYRITPARFTEFLESVKEGGNDEDIRKFGTLVCSIDYYATDIDPKTARWWLRRPNLWPSRGQKAKRNGAD